MLDSLLILCLLLAKHAYLKVLRAWMNLLKIKYAEIEEDLDETILYAHLGKTVATYRPYSEV